jgi:Ca2+-binding EF-hand superfamily protein
MRKIRKAMLLSVAIAVCVIALKGTAMEQAGGIQELDQNSDGTITLSEAQSAIEAQFARMDTDHNGVLSKSEFVTARMAAVQRLDTDGNGQITRSELRSAFLARRRH